MSKVLTYHNQSLGEHWFTSAEYRKKEIEAMKDPEGGNTDTPPTSVPSPFAQIDLVRAAFKNITREGELKGSRIDFKLVSDCLDVGEMLFNKDTLRDNIRIITWDKKRDLGALLQSPNIKHRRLGEAIKLFLEQDAKAYNFKDLQRIYLIEYRYKIIGGTSPSTLFFSSSNDLSFVDIKMANNDKLFDNSHCHLHDRDEDFQLFLYTLQKAMPGFNAKFREIAEYLNLSLKVVEKQNPALYDKINRVRAEDYFEDFDELDTGIANDKIYLLDFPLRKKKSFSGTVDSDFEIVPSKIIEGKKPLVLQNKHDGKSRSGAAMIYYTHPFRKETPIPYYSHQGMLEERELPGLTGVKYPHLLISDLLEPYLIRLVFPINKDKYFDGNLSNAKEKKDYILPISSTFFDYFDVDFLMNGAMPDGRKVFEMEMRAGGSVRVTLRIPVKNQEYITYERLYMASVIDNDVPKPDLDRNKGVIIENQFGVTIFPFIKVSNPTVKNHYRVMLLDRDILGLTRNNDYKLEFFEDRHNAQVPIVAETMRSDKNELRQEASSKFYILENQFSYIQVGHSLAKGIIVPKFIEQSVGNKQFHFAVDFGTTNTHVEFKEGERGVPKPFEITEADIQVGTLHDPRYVKEDRALHGTGATAIFEEPIQLFPEKLGAAYNYQFPQRTIIAERKNLDFSKTTYAMADFNIPFVYEKQSINKNNTEINSNLKWSNYVMGAEEERRVRAFFEKLLFMMRAKILLNQGNLDQSTLLWFYPSSMMEGRVNRLQKLWDELFAEYISDREKPKRLSESIAPFYYYKQKHKVSASYKPVVSVDIGGGTTDVVIYQNNKPIVLTSFKFAANSIFGDGFSDYGNAGNNGFVVKYQEKIRHLLNSNSLYGLEKVYKDISDTQISEDIVAFFFSLENNKQISNGKIPISFTKMLEKDDEMRIVFVVFYVAIVYHIANLMKAKELDMPRYITFSGNGSRVLNVLSSSNSTLENLATLVIQKVYAEEYDRDGLNIIREEDKPKEATCKGGLMMDEHFDFDEIERIKTTLLGTEEAVLIKNNIRYKDLDEEILGSVAEEYRKFIHFLFDLNKEFNFNGKLEVAVNHLDLYKEELLRNLMQKINDGIEVKRKEMTDKNKPVEETLFFYALIDSLNSLAYRVAQL